MTNKKSKKTRKPKKLITKEYTMDEVAKHKTKSDAWLVINGNVYDITKWIKKHPGGSIIMNGAGKDATKMYEAIGHSANSKSILKTLKIGKLKKKS